MGSDLFLQGMIIGFSIAAPVGPISLVCIHRTINGGRLHGICSGLGVATSDSFYAAIVFLGMTAVSGFILAYQTAFRFIAGIALVCAGILVFRSVPAAVRNDSGDPDSYFRDYLSLFAVAVANPFAIIVFMTILPGFGIVAHGTTLIAAAPFVAGVFTGSSVWWIILCGSLGSIRSRLSTDNLVWINKASGTLIAGSGAGMLVLLLVAPALLP
ncbi:MULTISPECIES: LysE family translocator [unclassified Methanoregula]|uniref:LysE family translocator n=1 Tax=unclassified Methanoregula TaxID=2649730 RepID=UPI0009D4D478|nr:MULTISPECIES: LysE family transporter [unclassified Methanoregula]OPX65488.1 MAG: LysE type translocator [Methanoregula sp. PtaB.Bin085]OPY37316.1 MAG: LysE type translocator [Methanoregula sp. PtaU1.Bin006]